MAAQAPPLAGSIVSASTQASTSSVQVLVRAPPFKSSFLSYGALQIMNSPSRTRCSGHGGGALGAQMNLFDRFSRVVKLSYANAVISTFEDPEKILEQTVIEMNDDLIKMRQATAQVWHHKSNWRTNTKLHSRPRRTGTKEHSLPLEKERKSWLVKH